MLWQFKRSILACLAFFSYRTVAETDFREFTWQIAVCVPSFLVHASSMACARDGPCSPCASGATISSLDARGVLFSL